MTGLTTSLGNELATDGVLANAIAAADSFHVVEKGKDASPATATENLIRADGARPGGRGSVPCRRHALHEALAAATGNTMLRQLIEQLAEPLLASRRSYAGHKRGGERFDAAVEDHRAILRAVESRDSRGAATAMRQHLGATERDLRAALRGDATA